MGGAIATKLVSHVVNTPEEAELAKRVKAFFVVDVVEGTALDVLPMMEQIVKSKPDSFDTIEEVIKYGVFNNLCKDKQSARVSMPD